MYVERDYQNLRIAAREVFEEGLAWKRVQRRLLLDRVPDRAEFIEQCMPARNLADGYYAWIDYLLWLSTMHDVVSFRDLTASEAEGIRLVRAARDEFAARHVHCPKCGELNDRAAVGCSSCATPFST